MADQLALTLYDSDFAGSVSVGRKHSTIRAYSIPRVGIVRFIEKTIQEVGPAVYFLIGESATSNDRPTVYVGRTDDFSTRVEDHLKKDESAWNRALLIIGNTLDTGETMHLERLLAQTIADAGRADLSNKKKPEGASHAQMDLAALQRLSAEAGLLVRALGYDFLQAQTISAELDGRRDSPLFFLWYQQQVVARGRYTPAGFYILADSKLRFGNEGKLRRNQELQREEMLADGTLHKVDGEWFAFTREYRFGSPSAAAEMVLVCAENGRRVWLTSERESLQEWETNVSPPAARPNRHDAARLARHAAALAI